MASKIPDPTSLREFRRAREGSLETLPATRTGAAPAFPLTKPSARERAVWRELWKKPQAVIWERMGNHYEVGMHVRTLVESEQPGATASMRALALRQASSLLLTESSLLAGGYRISSAQQSSAAHPPTSAVEAKRRQIPSSRGRLAALPETSN